MNRSPTEPLPHLAVIAGPTATVLNTPPLVTGDQARRRHGLEGTGVGEPLRAQRLAAPVTVYIRAGSAHPLEDDVAALSAPADGFLAPDGSFRKDRGGPEDVPVYRAQLRPDDGLYLLPYLARRLDGSPWEGEAEPRDGATEGRQTFYADAERLFEEIDRFGLDADGRNGILSRSATYHFRRAAPSAGRTSEGEVRGTDFFPYSPVHLAQSPHLTTLATLTNEVQRTMDSGRFDGALWLEGSPAIEETLYWLHLLVDTDRPIAGTVAQRAHGALSADGDRNVVDAVGYLTSMLWADERGRDCLGAVLVVDELVHAARDVHKVDGRVGGYRGAGESNGVLASIGLSRPAHLLVRPAKRHTHTSAVNLHRLPRATTGVERTETGVLTRPVTILDDDGMLAPGAIPTVTFARFARYATPGPGAAASDDIELRARIDHNLRRNPLAGFVLEGNTPYGRADAPTTAILREAACSGMPVVCVGRGSVGGTTPPPAEPLFLGGANLTATKARILLMACLLRFGAPPPATDPRHPTADEIASIKRHVVRLQGVFDTH